MPERARQIGIIWLWVHSRANIGGVIAVRVAALALPGACGEQSRAVFIAGVLCDRVLPDTLLAVNTTAPLPWRQAQQQLPYLTRGSA